MTIYFIVSPMGAGKTLTMTLFGYLEHCEGRKVYSNYPVTFPHTPIKTPEEMASIKNGVFLGDELWSWLDSRQSGSEGNKAISRILLKSRKRGYDIYHTAQFYMAPDKRLREHTDYVVVPKFNQGSQTCTVQIHRYTGKMNVGDLLRQFTFDATPIFGMYNSYDGIYSDLEPEVGLSLQ